LRGAESFEIGRELNHWESERIEKAASSAPALTKKHIFGNQASMGAFHDRIEGPSRKFCAPESAGTTTGRRFTRVLNDRLESRLIIPVFSDGDDQTDEQS
jgi:hypothetical protein